MGSKLAGPFVLVVSCIVACSKPEGVVAETLVPPPPRGPSKLDVTGQTPLPQSLAELAVETFLDACLGETVAALALREAAGGAEKRQIASLLDRIAGDEERHAELAWRTVAWALREGGAPVREALSAAMEAVREEGSPPPSGSRAS